MNIGDIIKKTFVTFITAGMLLYLLQLRTQNTTIVTQGSNSTAYGGLLIVFGYVFINYVVYHFHIRRNRMTLFVLGIALIILADTSLINDAANKIYIGDIVKILGVIFTIAGPAKLFISAKKEQEIKESNVEVIEV